MGLFHWIFGKHQPRPPDPERSTSVALLPRWQAELAVAELNEASIDAVLSDEYTSYLTTARNDARAHVYVMEPDARAAEAAIAAIVDRPSPNIVLRPATFDDEAYLGTMLLNARALPPDAAPLPDDVLDDPTLAQFLSRFGHQPGDVGWIAQNLDGDPIGAAWARLVTNTGCGHVDDRTPVIAIAVDADHRRHGYGTDLLVALFDTVGRCSASLDYRNPAIRLFQQFGFVVVDTPGDSLTLLREVAA